MSAKPAYLPKVSLNLSRTLDEVGLNTLTVKRRRHTYLILEQLKNISFLLFREGGPFFHFGSQTEGATTPGLKSDIDTLLCRPGYTVIQGWAEWEQGKETLLMVQEDTAPGYCRLQLLKSDIPAARDTVPNDFFALDPHGRVVMKNTPPNSVLQGLDLQRSGPAVSGQGGPGFVPHDFVVALRCSFWPEQADAFTRRHRRHGWPSQRLVEQAVAQGVFLVPVGYKLSPDEPLEWRISASLAERCLMFSLSIVHIKCYVMLKMLVKTFIEPYVEKCISSYHCKTAILHSTANTDSGFWRDDNLLQCVNHCLEMLFTWVRDGFCPQFIIPEENLFAGKVTARNRDTLLSILTNMLKSDGRAVLHIGFEDLGQKLQAKLNTEPSCVPVCESLATVSLLGELEYDRHDNIFHWVEDYLVIDPATDRKIAIRSLHHKLVVLKEHLRKSDKHDKRALYAFFKFLSCLLGSMLASVALSRKARLPLQAIKLFRCAVRYDIASRLKLASAFYCSGNYRITEAILLKLDAHFRQHEVMAICRCHEKECRMSLRLRHRLFALRTQTGRDRLFAHCVRFLPQEIHCVPHELRIEQYRSGEEDDYQRYSEQDKWMILVAVDCLPYMLFLEYVTFGRLGKHDQQRKALYNLNQCIREDHDFGHPETVWNLLGQCMELRQEPEAAMACYRRSLEIRPDNNAANLHVQNLRYTRIRKGLS